MWVGEVTSEKIIEMAALGRRSEALKKAGKKIVMCHGTFDLLHVGHTRYFQRSRLEGDVLLVTVTADEFVNKGPGRPVFSGELRAENIAALECVDYVAISYAVSAVDAINEIKPDVYVKGSEYRSHQDDVTGNIVLEADAVASHGGEVFFTDEITFSSSTLLNENFDVFPPETRSFLAQFRRKFSEKELQHAIDGLSELNVLVIGDAIVDQYHYVSTLGQTGKGNVLAVKYDNEEQFAGGSLAVANHAAMFAKSVTVLSALGEKDSHEEFIREKLLDNVTPVFARFLDSPTVTKRRFVDSDLSKLFEVYFFDPDAALADDGIDLSKWVDENAADFDLVIVADFGNGLISDELVKTICDKPQFLAVNTQINSGNRGYHVINKYPRADFISLNEPELRLASHRNGGSLEKIGRLIGDNLGAGYVAVTRGVNGAMMIEVGDQTAHKIPALSSRVVDRIGAGDAFLAISALFLAKGYDPQAAAFVGSVAAAIDVQIVCNREPIDPVKVKKYLTTLLK